MYILYNADGSVKSKKLDQYIQQGNSYSNVLFVSIADHRNFTLAGICTLPNGVKTTCTISPLETTQVIDGVTYYGKTLSITESETISAGTIRINVSATENSQVLVTFSVYLTVNETAYDSNNPVLVSWQQYNTLVTEVDSKANVEFQTTSDPAYTIAQSVKVTKNGQSTYYRFASGGGGSTYTSGNGIVVDNTNHTIAIDDQVVATKTDLTSKQDKSNLVSSWQETPDDTHYPSEKLVKDSIATETQNRQTADTLITGSVNQINAKIPSQASALNQLADKSFVNSSIATNTANFLGTLDVVSDLGLQYGATHSAVVNALNQHTFSQEKTNNDYCFVVNKDNNDNVIYERYKYASTTFAYEYTLNNSSFTASQWNSINSGITSGKVATYDAYETSKQDTIDSQHKLSADLLSDGTTNKPSEWNNKLDKTGTTQEVEESANFGIAFVDDSEEPTKYSAFRVVYGEDNQVQMGVSDNGDTAEIDITKETVSFGVSDGENEQVLQITKDDATLTTMGESDNSIATKLYVDTHGGGSAEGAVKYNEAQTLTTEQKAQARSNIGASEVIYIDFGD